MDDFCAKVCFVGCMTHFLPRLVSRRYLKIRALDWSCVRDFLSGRTKNVLSMCRACGVDGVGVGLV